MISFDIISLVRNDSLMVSDCDWFDQDFLNLKTLNKHHPNAIPSEPKVVIFSHASKKWFGLSSWGSSRCSYKSCVCSKANSRPSKLPPPNKSESQVPKIINAEAMNPNTYNNGFKIHSATLPNTWSRVLRD